MILNNLSTIEYIFKMKIYILCNLTEINPDDFSSSLDIRGLKDADEIIEKLEDINIDKIYCSPYLKTVQTIYPFCNKTNKQINIEHTFHDAMYKPIIPNIEMHNPRSINSHFGYSYIFNRINTYYKSKLFSSNICSIENNITLQNRIFPFLHNLCHRYKEIPKNILIVTHQAILNSIINFCDRTNCSYTTNKKITEISIPSTWNGIN
jgi:broad specificity phosphatase PhoE